MCYDQFPCFLFYLFPLVHMIFQPVRKLICILEAVLHCFYVVLCYLMWPIKFVISNEGKNRIEQFLQSLMYIMSEINNILLFRSKGDQLNCFNNKLSEQEKYIPPSLNNSLHFYFETSENYSLSFLCSFSLSRLHSSANYKLSTSNLYISTVQEKMGR